MKKMLMAAAITLGAVGFALPSQASAAAFSPGLSGAALDKANSMTVEVQHRHRRAGRAWHRGYQPGFRYSRRPHYGRIVGGIALGALLAGSAYAYAQRPPAPGLCWYWADPYQRQGYWDYC